MRRPQNIRTLSRLTWLIHTSFFPQNGICIKNYNFWPKNDGEKWSRKNIFEIPPCGSHFLFFFLLTTFEENHKFSNKNNYFPEWKKIRNIFLQYVLDLIYNLPVKAKFLSRFQLEGKNNVRMFWYIFINFSNT